MEDWRFEPETYLMEALEAHYDNDVLPGDNHHADTEVCATFIIEWLRHNNVELDYRGPRG